MQRRSSTRVASASNRFTSLLLSISSFFHQRIGSVRSRSSRTIIHNRKANPASSGYNNKISMVSGPKCSRIIGCSLPFPRYYIILSGSPFPRIIRTRCLDIASHYQPLRYIYFSVTPGIQLILRFEHRFRNFIIPPDYTVGGYFYFFYFLILESTKRIIFQRLINEKERKKKLVGK